MSVTERDLGWNRIKREMALADGSYTKVGIQANATYDATGEGSGRDGDEDMVEIGASHEFGIGNPKRSFLRSTTDAEAKRVDGMIQSGLEAIKQGRASTKHVLGTVGEYMTGKVQAKIVSLRTPPNSPATIARKGSSNPLIDTGQMRQSITHVETMKKGRR